jgi:hypothetical protein
MNDHDETFEMIEHRLKVITNKLHSALDALTLQKAAAQTMLRALHEANKAIPLTGHATALKAVVAAIAQAEAAGIKAESPGNFIPASSHLTKGDAP